MGANISGSPQKPIDTSSVKIDHEELNLRKALEKNPRNPQALFKLALLHMQRNDLFAAIDLLQRAAKLQPTAPTLNNLGVAYRRIGRIDLAMEVLRKAVELDPQNASGHYNYAGVLDAFGDYEQALEHLRMAGERSAHLRIPSIAASAGIKERMGMVDEAFTEVSELLDKGEKSPPVLRVFCNIVQQYSRYHEHIDRAIDLATAAINENRIATYEISSYYFFLGHLNQAKQDFDAAFRCFELGHQHMRYNYNEASEISVIERIKSAWDTIGCETPLKAGKRTYIFIIGMPRSGSTLIEQILSVNEKGADLGECGFFSAALQDIFSNTNDPAATGERALSPGEISQVRTAYNHRAFQTRRPTDVVTDKSLYNGYFIGQLLQTFPNAKIIWARRDPRDTCLSCYTFDFVAPHAYRHDLRTLGRFHNRYEQLLNFWKARYPEQIHIAQYEDIIHDPATGIRELINFCGLPWDDRYLEFHQHKRTIATASYSQVSKPIYTSSVGRWKNYEQHLRPLFEELEIEGNPPLEPTA